MSIYDDGVTSAKNFLEADGFVVLRTKSHQDAQRRYAIAKSEAQWCRDEMERTQQWAQNELGGEIRSLRDRCTFLYGAARAAGCTVEELAGKSVGGRA